MHYPLLEQFAADGMHALPAFIQIMITTAMQLEQQFHTGVGLYEWSFERHGDAHGYKLQTATPRVGNSTCAVPQVRDGNFYPQALEKGLRSERALTLALTEMDGHAVPTRNVAAITEQVCDMAVSCTQVSHAVAQPDAVLDAWRTPLR